MQVIKGDHYNNLSKNNRIRQRTIKATRGLIFDRNEEILIDNYPYFNLVMIPENVKDIDSLLKNLSDLIQIDENTLKEKIHEARHRPSFKPVTLMENLSREELSKIEAGKLNIPGIEIMVESVRYYPYKTLASHIIGYLSEINSEKLKLEEYRGYKPGDLIGNFGIERTYEELLKGEDGLKEVEVDAFGRGLATLGIKKAKPGSTLFLTLDSKLQSHVEKIFDGKAGAAVVMDVNNGKVLAQFSKPNFDPSLFVKGISSKDWKILSENPLHPLQDKVIMGQYSPGSVFKLVVAAAALEEGVINKSSSFFCRGSYRLGRSRFSCWKKSGHGKVNLVDAIIQTFTSIP
jgi:penicillin-binding protein 2